MSQSWKPLPDDLSEPARRLAEELRAVKDAHRISLAELGKRTYLSKASWERWLNGKRLITPQALAGLIAAVECDAALLTSLLRQAEAEREEGATELAADLGPEPEPEPEPEPVPVPVPLPGLPVEQPPSVEVPLVPAAELPTGVPMARVATAVAAAVAAVLVLVAGLWLRGPQDGGGAAAAILPTATASEPAPLCQGVGCAGKDPQAMGCENDDHTLLRGNVGQVILYMHYSPRCRAAWAGITDASPGDTATITTNTGWQETALIHWGYDAYSVMVDASPGDTTLRVCGHQKGGAGCMSEVTDPAARAAAAPLPAPPIVTTTPTS
jgi:transcriptional regulator with XRE-family HTH domain